MGAEDFEYLFEKKYGELTDSEKAQLSGMVDSEEEFEGMKEFMTRIETSLSGFETVPDSKVKAKLDDVFYEQHPKDRGVGLWAVVPTLFPADKKLWQQPMLRVAALIIVALLVIPLFRIDKDTTVQVAENKHKVTGNVESPEVDTQTGDKVSSPTDQTVVTEEPHSAVVVEQPTVRVPDFVPQPISSAPGMISDDIMSFAATGSTHPDGVFVGDVAFDETVRSGQKPVSSNIAVLDLLTATF